jgi:hypothetical protein
MNRFACLPVSEKSVNIRSNLKLFVLASLPRVEGGFRDYFSNNATSTDNSYGMILRTHSMQAKQEDMDRIFGNKS